MRTNEVCTAMCTGLQLISERASPLEQPRAWKLFLLAPRMQQNRGRENLASRQQNCSAAAKPSLEGSGHNSFALLGALPSPRRKPTPRSQTLLPERPHTPRQLLAAGRALAAEPHAPGSAATLSELRDPDKCPLSAQIAEYPPEEPGPFPLPSFLTVTTRRGAAARPPSATNGHLRILLRRRTQHCPALQNPTSRGRRALVVGDALRRLVGRTLVQAFALRFEQARLPHQYRFNTQAGSVSAARSPRNCSAPQPSRLSDARCARRTAKTAPSPALCPPLLWVGCKATPSCLLCIPSLHAQCEMAKRLDEAHQPALWADARVELNLSQTHVRNAARTRGNWP